MYSIYVTGFYQEPCPDPLWSEPGPIPRDAAETGGDVQLTLDNYHHDDYDPDGVLGATYATEHAARTAARKLLGPDRHGVRLDFTILEV